MSDEPEWSTFEGLALTFSQIGFEAALQLHETFEALRMPEIRFMVVDVSGAWRIIDTHALISREAEGAKSLIEYFRSHAVEVEPDFSTGRMTIAGNTRSVVFVPSGNQVPGIEPTPTYTKTYICDHFEAHIVSRPVGSAGAPCGAPRTNGAPCPGVLSEW